MKVKALRYKDTKEFVWVEEQGGEPMVFTSAIPKVQPDTATLKDMRGIFENEDYYEGLELDWVRLELAEFHLVETNTIGADIRNKLSPCLNLVSMLEMYFDAEEKSSNLEKYIKDEMKMSKKSVEYIANLL
jgi:hypothetical protein